MNECNRGPRGGGGAGSAAVVVGTGEVVVPGGTTGRPPVVDPGTVVPTVGLVPPVDACTEPGIVDGAAWVPLVPPCEEATTAAIAPAPATTAIPAASKAFFTWPEATLARA
jgi:hypothetical protein